MKISAHFRAKPKENVTLPIHPHHHIWGKGQHGPINRFNYEVINQFVVFEVGEILPTERVFTIVQIEE